jgi:hypothetical protein
MPYGLASPLFATSELSSELSFFREPQKRSRHHRHSSNHVLPFSNIAAPPATLRDRLLPLSYTFLSIHILHITPPSADFSDRP